MKLVLLLTFGFVCAVRSQSGSSCQTPNGERATCKSIYTCPVFLRALKNRNPTELNFVRESNCGFDEDPLVCCGSVSNWQPINSPAPAPDRVSKPSRNNNQPINSRLLPGRNVCGLSSIDNRILNGEATALDEFPWMTLLEYRGRGGRTSHSCGGMLISNRYVLTAAHCVTGRINQDVGSLFRVRLGEYNTQTEQDCQNNGGFQECSDPHQDIGVEQAIAHPDYKDGSINRYHDIAIVRLSRPVQFTAFIRPICLPINGERSKPGEKLYVAGWGLTEKNIYSPVKLKLKVPLVSSQQCARTFSRAGVTVQDGQMCAGGERQRDSCQGDSGGPLMRPLPNNQDVWYAEGIVSFGAACGTKDVPGIYTRISEYMSWITENMRP